MTMLGSERTHFVQLTPKIRARLEATLDNLIGLLDALDGDAEAEQITTCEFDPAYRRMGAQFPALDLLLADDREAGGDEEVGEQPPVWPVPAALAPHHLPHANTPSRLPGCLREKNGET